MTHPYVPNPLREETPTKPERRVFHIALQVPQHGPFASNDPKASLAVVVVSVESTSLAEAGLDLAATLDDLVRDYQHRRLLTAAKALAEEDARQLGMAIHEGRTGVALY